MPELTLLDYEVFNALKAHLAREDDAHSAAFSEAVLGYGFRAGEDVKSPVEFILLCHPSSSEVIREWIGRSLSTNLLSLHGIEISVSVQSSSPAGDLLRALTLPKEQQLPNNTTIERNDLSEWVQVSLGQTIRQVVLNEHRKIILPAYLLRYTPYTSPNLIILRSALGQIHYLHQSGRPSDEFEQRTVSARMSEISRWSSFSRTSIYRLLHEDPRSRWLVDVENKGSFQNDHGQHISQPNQYLLQPLQLTPGDATDLTSYIESHQEEWQTIDDCLVALARVEPRKVLAYPYRLPQKDDLTEPASILSLVQRCYGPLELNAERLALLDKVRDNLIGRDFITVPWYVLRNLLPVYGASIITLFMMCQPLLFRQGGVQRDTFWLPGGDETLVAWTNDRSLAKYFPKSNAKGRGRPASKKGSSDSAWRKGKRDLLSDFFLRVETRKDRQGQTQWKIKVNDYPILDHDEHLINNLYRILEEIILNGQLSTLLNLFDRDAFSNSTTKTMLMSDRLYRTPLTPNESGTLSLIAGTIFSDFETPVNPTFSNFETPVSRLISIFEPPVRQLISESATPVPVLFSVFETYLKILYIIKDSIKIIENANLPPDSTELDDPKQVKKAEDWDYQQILNSVSPDFRNKLLFDTGKQRGFIALLIQNSLNARVQQPLNLALSKALQGQINPDAAALRLAKQPPMTLLSVLVMVQTDPNRVNYLQEPVTRAIAADIEQLLMGEDRQKRPILIQRLIDALAY